MEVIAASPDTCEPRKYPSAFRRRDTYAAHKYPSMRQLLPIYFEVIITFLPCDKKVRNAKEFRLVSCGKLTKSDRANKTTLYIIGKVL